MALVAGAVLWDMGDNMEFKAFNKIARLDNSQMTISQKLHGTNALLVVYEEDGEVKVRAGSRTRWIFPGDDNYGFAAFVEANKEALISSLGLGWHYGEWAGLGINSGEGRKERVFALFEWWKHQDKTLPKGVEVVPVLYRGPLDTAKIEEVMEDLRINGSKFSHGFMRPEGVVVDINGVRYKKVFDAEEVAWTGGDPNKVKVQKMEKDYNYLCQPVRLEKLLSKDEQLTLGYPETLPTICKMYMEDLVEEGQITGDEDEIKAVRKGATGQVFKFIKAFISKTGKP